jgi:hypothetical protein
VAAELIDGQFVIRDAAEDALSPIDEAMQKAVEEAGDRANEIIDALANTLFEGRDDLKEASKALLDDILKPYADTQRRLDLEADLARKAWMTGLTSPDSRDRAQTALYLEGIIEQYELIAPGALRAGELVNPALQAGIDKNLNALVTYLQTTGTKITNLFDLADVFEQQGDDTLAGYARGLASAAAYKVSPVAEQMRLDLHSRLDDSLYGTGYEVALTYARGLRAAAGAAAQAAWELRRKVGGILEFSGSPPYTHSTEIGEMVATTWGGGLISSLRSLIPSVASTIGSVASAMTARPMGLAMAGLPSMGAPLTPSATVGTGPSTVNNTWNLTVNGVPYTFNNRDDFIKALDGLSAFGDGRLSG